jgi:hypothetical protein
MQLVCEPPAYEFAAEQLLDLQDALDRQVQDTSITPLGTAGELIINPDTARTAVGGCQYTATALLQVCAALCSGLYGCVTELCGQYRTERDDRRLYSLPLATDTFNRVLKIRFQARLANFQVVRNQRTKTLDGILGPKYKFVSNQAFLQHAQDSLQEANMAFHSAYLYGRQLVVRFWDPRNELLHLHDDPHHAGMHFGNSEIGGKAMRRTCMVVCRHTGECALGDYAAPEGARIKHAGHDFNKKLSQLLSLDSSLEALQELTEPDWQLLGATLAEAEATAEQLSDKLSAAHIPAALGRRVGMAALMVGRDPKADLSASPSMDRQRIVAGRTSYDLFRALTRSARRQPLAVREQLEQAAFSLLTGRLNLGGIARV